MDGENNGKPYFLMDDLGGPSLFFGNTHINFTTPETFGVPFPLFFWVAFRSCEVDLELFAEDHGGLGRGTV